MTMTNPLTQLWRWIARRPPPAKTRFDYSVYTWGPYGDDNYYKERGSSIPHKTKCKTEVRWNSEGDFRC